MKRTWTIIGVADVPESFKWYQSLFGPPEATPAHDDFNMALPRARSLVRRLEEEPHMNPNTGTMEFSLRDPDGYYVTVSAINPA
jgi:hypothetical protein